MHCYGSSRWGDVETTQELAKGTDAFNVACKFNVREREKFKSQFMLPQSLIFFKFVYLSHMNMSTSEILIKF